MPRDGSGVYSKPAGTTATPNTTIESSKYNSVVDDLVNDANAARPVTAGGTGETSARLADGTWRFKNTADPSKLVAFDLSGLPAATTRTLAVPNKSGTIALTDDLNPGGVRAATTANITIATGLNAGDAIDGVTLANGDLVLVKNQTAPAENGVYVVGVTPARSPYFDTWAKFLGAQITVAEGAVNFGGTWVSKTASTGTLGTTAITFQGPPLRSYFESAEQTITAGGGMTLAHGLGLEPILCQIVLVCKTADASYSVGDHLIINPGISDAAGLERGLAIVTDATNLQIRIGAAAASINLLDKSTGSAVGITNSRWKLVARCWA